MSDLVFPNSASTTKTQEEEDHLARSTKKIKSKDHLETMDIAENPGFLPTLAPVTESVEILTEGQKAKSFKEALAAPRHTDFYFDDSMDSISDDEAAHPKTQAVHRNNSSPEGPNPTVEANLAQQPTASPNNNGHLQNSEAEGDNTFGPWMMVTKRTRKPVINRKTQSTGPSPTQNKFSELSEGPQQTEDMGRGKKTTRLGLEKEASSSPQAAKHGLSTSHTASTVKVPQAGPSTAINISTQNPPTNPRSVDMVPSPLPSTRHQPSYSLSDKPSKVVNVSTPPEIPMKDSPSEILLTLSPTLPPTTKLPIESDRSTNIKHRKPPDPGNEHGEGGGNRADSKQPPDGESSIEPNVRTRDRSNSPRRYGMVDRADPDR
ncbi:hypothetical protein LOK49_LG10G02565 [Camellia lanceoleosa]|uniref:Uncharacterized protein n=1 Tax=Camellia lanceoleosa TaxID=1840588 RepID=A0ACC0GA31_9ERIC|nr:hypothetical protein LOK49_LG10G02565 [Camellia lanceoleosa]